VTDDVRRVSSRLVLEVHQPLRMMLQVSVDDPTPARLEESLRLSIDGRPLAAEEITIPGEGRVHLVRPAAGVVTIEYDATVTGRSRPYPVSAADKITYLRPSRYAESDRLAAMAQAEFGGITGAGDLLAAVSSWVGSRLAYVPGSSGPTDGAVDTMLQRQGVCRDYAHLVIALLRGLDVPARLAAVYAPGLDPMDFHAVAEAVVDDQWRVVDATLLAPRSSLVRIATGRDAADTAFLSTYGGAADLLEYEVTAVVDPFLPIDNVNELVSLR
jgi:transglutaminase-like putative cysteine protease